MASTVPPKPSDHHFTISNLISRFRAKRKSKRAVSQDAIQDSRPPLIATPLPLVLSEHQQSLSKLGWTTITFPHSTPGHESTASPAMLPVSGPHPLQAASEALLTASQAFFAQPAADKQTWKHRLGSEEGWSSIRGEKEFITLRSLEYCPEILRAPAHRFWSLMGDHLSTTLGRIGTTLALPDNEDESKGLRQFLGPCASMPDTDAAKTATMLRLFRYEGCEAKEVAEPHADLGLLSVVIGNVPGLEVWDGTTWFACEREMQRAGRHGATLLAGRQLEGLSNGRYPAGGHRVVSYGRRPGPDSPCTVSAPRPGGEESSYRFSIVFVLRAHEPVVIHSADFETGIVGTWPEAMRGVSAGTFYEQIRSRHFNINIDVEEREKQRRRIRGM